ncbi:MAG: hypothetical protein CM15mP65_24340 [Crocinitomicaceae bacterium]|nr:MAG: hypothetical protein CM15mP65_24340 [Crocinitomicaceae bacterium]
MVNTSLKNIDFLIQNKDQINDRELEAIYNLSVRYPYSSFCHFFLYSVLKKQNRTGVENVLKKTAIRFHDRSLLKKLSENSMVKQNTKEKIEVTNIDEIENKEQEKVLNENVYSNIINDNIIQEITETKDQDHKEKEVEKPPEMVKSNQLPKPFEDWLFKHPLKKTKREITVDEILNSLENRKTNKIKLLFSAPDAAKKSLETNDDLVTETLAEIHIQQGNYPKAIEIYQKLILLNPEKKLLFASRIEFIKQKTQL